MIQVNAASLDFFESIQRNFVSQFIQNPPVFNRDTLKDRINQGLKKLLQLLVIIFSFLSMTQMVEQSIKRL